MNKFRQLLPPTAAATERAMERATAEPIIALQADIVRDVKSPERCPAHLLPWLAWEFGVDYWDETWSEAQKRQVIADMAYVHQHRGTVSAVRRSLSSVGYPTRVIEWFQDTPRREPYTFRVELYSTDTVNDELYSKIRRQIDYAKNLRSWLSSIEVISDVGGNGHAYIAGAVTMHIDIEIPFGDNK
ncbi:phage tail protein I [Mixta calida]|uniref:phage tail protein I n=1 Tax=Mixta calida TaxID=665913 RepID=UPI0034D749C1